MKNDKNTKPAGQQGQTLKVLLITLCLLPMLMINACSSVSDGKQAEEKVIETAMFQLEPFIVNIADQTDSRFLKACLCIEVAGPAASEKAKAKTGVLRDAIIMIISGKTYEVISQPEGRAELKEQVRMSAARILGENLVHDVYLTDFITQ